MMGLSMIRNIIIKSFTVIALLSAVPAYAYNLLSPSNGAQITAIDRQLNATTGAADNLTDDVLSTRWLSNKQTNDVNFIFNSAKDVACFNRFDLNNYGNNDRSISRFMLFRTLDAALSSDTGQTGWTPIAANLNPTGIMNHVIWPQGGRLTSINSQLNSTNGAAANIHDGDYNSRWLSSKANNQLEFAFDTNWDGIANDEINIKQIKIYNYGTDDRSVKQYQIETTIDGSAWSKLEVPGTSAGQSGFNFALSWEGASLSAINQQLNTTSWAAKNIHDGDNNTRWLSSRNGNTLDFVFDVNLNGTTGADGDTADLFTLDSFYLRNYGVDDRSVKNFQVEVKTSSNSNWAKLKVPGSAAGDANFNFLLNIQGGTLDSINSQLNTTSWAAKNIHDGDKNTRWLSSKGNNTLDFSFDANLDGTTGADGDSADLFTLEKFFLRNYGNDDRSVKNFQVEVKTSTVPNWTKLVVPGSAAGEPDFNFLLSIQGGMLENINSQLNTTSWAAKNIHDGDSNTRWLSNKGSNTLDFEFDVNLDGTTGADGDAADLFTIEKFFLRNYGTDDRSIREFQIEVKTAANGSWKKIEVPGSGPNQANYNFSLQANGGKLDLIDRQLNTTNWAAKNIHDGDINTRWLSNRQSNTLEFSFDTDLDGSTGNGINLDTLSFRNYGNDDRSVQTFEIDIKVNNGVWQAVNDPGGGTVFTANMDANEQTWSIGSFNNVTHARIRTLSNYGDPSYTGARELTFSGLSVGPSYTYTAAMHGNGETFSLDVGDQPFDVKNIRLRTINNHGDPTYTGAREFKAQGMSIGTNTVFTAAMHGNGEFFTFTPAEQPVDVTNVRFRSINNHGDPSYTGAREFEVLGESVGPSYVFTAAMHGNGETFTIDPGERPVDVKEVRFRTINNHGDPSYTGAREFRLFGDSLGASHTFSSPMTTGPHTVTLDNDDIVSSAIGTRFITIQNHGDPSYTGMRELELLGDPVGPDYIFKSDMNSALQSFNFTSAMGRVFRLHTLSNHGDPSYTGAAEIALQSSDNCILSEWRMDESDWTGAANEVRDSTGNSFHGSAEHDITTEDAADPLVNGGICRVGQFNDDGYVELPTIPNVTESFTLTGWFNTRDNSEHGQRIFADDETSTGGFALSVGAQGVGMIQFYHRSLDPVSLDSSPNLVANNQWYFAAAVLTLLPNDEARKELYVFNTSGNLLDYKSEIVTGTLQPSTGKASLGGEVDGAEEANRFNGFLDEVKVFKGPLTQVDLQAIVDFERVQKNWDGSTRACAGTNVLDHIEIIHDGQGITCSTENITFKACQTADCSSLYTNDVNITFSPSDSNTTWSGTTTISNGSSTLQLNHTVPGNITLGVSSSTPAANNGVLCNDGSGNNCTMNFSDSGFIFSMANQNSCQQTSNYIDIEAVKKSDTSVSCVPAFSGNRSINFSTTYNNPASGVNKISIEPLGGSEETAPDINPVTIDFTPDNNKFKARYDDAGQVTLTANYSGGDGLNLSGSQTFIVIPDHLSVEARLPGNGSILNNTLISGIPVRKAVTDHFEVEVMAMCDDGTTQAENFMAEAVLSGELPSGVLGALGGDIDRSDFGLVGGVYDKLLFDDINYSEVGYFTLRADVTDYLGTGSNLTGTQVTGRFIPDHFTLISSDVTTDWGESFVYMDQAEIKVDYTLEAQNGNNIITQNYNAGFAPALISGSAKNNDNVTELLSRLSSFSGTWLNGQIVYSDKIQFNRNSSPDGPFQLLVLGLAVDDQESGVDILLEDLDMDSSSSGACDPLTTCTAKQLSGLSDIRYGRLAVENAYGPVSLPLSAVTLKAEYYDSGISQFKLNSDDSTTDFDSAVIDWSAASYSDLSDGDIESTGSGTLNSGFNTFSIHKTGSPTFGPGISGYADYSFSTKSWLKFDWKGGGDVNPEPRASFGIFKRSKRLIFTREVY